uniref:Uncharacterized protein n=1 Tax=Brassica campestris TaxID=3711 RepID=A0A3P6CQ39_BRACM|nr:unnamed protein product [Brassica rapa]
MDLNLCAYHDSFLLKSTKISSKCRACYKKSPWQQARVQV